MQVVLGKEYKLDIGKDIKNEPTPWFTSSNPQSKLSRYTTWGDIDGLLVIAKAKTKLLTNYVSVVLVSIPKEPFLITQKYLTIPTRRLPRKAICICDSLDFYRHGCRCPETPW